VENERDCCFDTWARTNAKRARKHGIAARLTARMVWAIEREGLAGRSVLDLGCGTGDLALATIARGAEHATGLDLGSGAIAEARALARERGLADRAAFEVADGSTTPLERHDVVALNRVFCCYPDARGLLGNSLPATGSVYAYTIPANRGARGLTNRAFARMANLWYASRRSRYGAFRVHIHDISKIEAAVAAAGFARRTSERRGLWHLAVWARDAGPATAGGTTD
jgi:SAM-dependent methyltransferase